MSAALLGVLFQFKTFAFIVLGAAFVASIVFAGGDWDSRRRFAATLILSGVCALPFVYRSMRLYADRRSELGWLVPAAAADADQARSCGSVHRLGGACGAGAMDGKAAAGA